MAGELVRDGLSDTFQTSLAIDKPVRKMHLFSGIPNFYAKPYEVKTKDDPMFTLMTELRYFV